MTFGEFKKKFENMPDDAAIVVQTGNGEIDYAVLAWEDKQEQASLIVISGN